MDGTPLDGALFDCFCHVPFFQAEVGIPLSSIPGRGRMCEGAMMLVDLLLSLFIMNTVAFGVEDIVRLLQDPRVVGLGSGSARAFIRAATV